MAKPRKLILAEYLTQNPRAKASDVMKLSQSQNLGVQVKTIDSKGDFVLKFSASDPWIKSSEWLHNYQVASKQRYEECLQVYQSLFPPEDIELLEEESLRELENLRLDVSRAYLKFNTIVESGEVIYPAQVDKVDDIIKTTVRKFGGNSHDTIYLIALGAAVSRDLVVNPEFVSLLNYYIKKRDDQQLQ